MTKILKSSRGKANLLKASVAPVVLGMAMLSAPAQAQNTDGNQVASDEADRPVIVVTGTLFRRTDIETASPVTVLDTEDLEQRGVSTIQEGLQQLVSNNGPAITNSFTANGAFAGGSSAVSLRGLTTSSTLVLFDGMRAAYYPLADDGTRNFVDLNTIPDDIVQRVEILRDGASSSYGADAIAGVVNIITRREIQGVRGRVEAGLSEEGDAAQYRATLTAGVGDLADQGFNAYVSGFYFRSEELENRQRGYPFNTGDERGICVGAACGPNNVQNGLNQAGVLTPGVRTASSPFLVRPYDAATNTVPQGNFQLLETNLCRGLGTYTLTAAEQAATPASHPTVCQEDRIGIYNTINPQIERFGGSARFTAIIDDMHEVYAQFNFTQANLGYDNYNQLLNNNAPTGIFFPRYSARGSGGAFSADSGPLTLPVFVCPAGINCDTDPQGQLNPNNPFAAAGQVARLYGRIPQDTVIQSRNRVYRAAIGASGPITDNIDYNISATAMHTDLRRTREGYVYIQHLLDVIADGSYNFVDPSQNSQAVNDYLTPTSIVDSSSDLYQVQGSITAELMDLPGGPLQLAGGVSVYYEAVDSPSGNTDFFGQTERYFSLNAFGATGSRTVTSLFGELEAPIIDEVTVNVSGRYDSYSSGQSAFSPKVGISIRPIPQVLIRGTYSEGFRIPSFGEANSLPTTGFVTTNAALFPDAYLATYGCSQATFNTCPTYISNSSYGLTTLGSPNLQPEDSRSFTAGILVEPIPSISFGVDYYNIRKTNAIASANTAPAIQAYYTGAPIPAGFNVVPDAPDVNNPGLQPRIAFVESGFINANRVDTEGLDFTAVASFDITDNITWRLSAAATYIINLSTTFNNGSTQSYEGTLGNFNLTAGSGTPEWRGRLQSSIDFGDTFTWTTTVQYFDGYNLSAEDQTGAGTAGQGGLSPAYFADDVDEYITVDMVGTVRIGDRYSLSLTVLNILDEAPPVDPVTYGAWLYNAVQGGTGILGRYYKVGATFEF